MPSELGCFSYYCDAVRPNPSSCNPLFIYFFFAERGKKKDCKCISRWLIVATGENVELFIPKITVMGRFNGVVGHARWCNFGGRERNPHTCQELGMHTVWIGPVL